MCAATAADSRGTSTKQRCLYSTSVDINRRAIKTIQSLIQNHMRHEHRESARKQRIARSVITTLQCCEFRVMRLSARLRKVLYLSGLQRCARNLGFMILNNSWQARFNCLPFCLCGNQTHQLSPPVPDSWSNQNSRLCLSLVSADYRKFRTLQWNWFSKHANMICHNLFSDSSPASDLLTTYIPSRQIRSSADTRILRMIARSKTRSKTNIFGEIPFIKPQDDT